MKLWIFVALIVVAIVIGAWLKSYGEKCEACQERKSKIISFLGIEKADAPTKAV